MMNTKKAYFGGGCFWCIEAGFQMVRGVSGVVSGYMGGNIPNPTYEQVCDGSSGHAEIIEVTYDPDIVTYRDLLNVFFTLHDPTTLNRQGNDIGTQYRSVVFANDDGEAETVQAVIAEIEKENIFENPIVTEVAMAAIFYPAESYHQEYYAKNPEQAYCRIIIAPKLQKLKERVAHLLV